jgi:mono/diheme cytochrome c family protein
MKPRLILALGLSALAPACSPDIAVRPGNVLPGDVPPAVPPSAKPPPTETPPARPGTIPPPISGGTLIIAHDGKTAIAADPDRDKVYVVDLQTRHLLRTIDLKPGDEPGRLAEDNNRRVHVALRSVGALATIDIDKGAVVGRRPVCGAPRGVAYDSARDLVHVACATGELRSLPAQGGEATRTLFLGPDLRDVVVQGDRLFVSRLKAAQVLELDASVETGAVVKTSAPPEFVGMGFDPMGQPLTIHTPPTAAWRTVGLPSGGVAMVHMRGLTNAVPTDMPGGYGGGPCKGGIVNTAISVLDDADHAPAAALTMNVLPVDLAISKDGTQVAVVDASSLPKTGFLPRVSIGPVSYLSGECSFLGESYMPEGQITAVAFDSQNRVIVQSREPAALFVLPDLGAITLSTESKRDAGHELFHEATGALISCASCHPEAGDDGHVWNFTSAGPRRTQSLRGGILGSEPFHWSGDMADLTHLTAEVMTKRMMGPTLTSDEVAALGRWIDAQPNLPAPPAQDLDAVERGHALFNNAEVGCFSCHSGDKLTNNLNADVGTGDKFQVPSLRGVAYRAPFLHTGCAATLRDRFGACGGGDSHGKTSQLSPQQLDDLTAYLGTL